MSSTLEATFLYHCAFAHSNTQPHVDVLLAPGKKGMQHIASLRVPEACVVDDGEHPGETQETEDAERRLSTDLIWRLEGYDLWIDPPTGAAALNPRPVKTKPTFEEGDKKWVLAPFRVAIDSHNLQEEAPSALQKGARVRVWDGTLSAAKPAGDLSDRLWQLEENGPAVGLCDQMEFEKDLGDRATATIRFRKFGEVRFKTVTLQPYGGVIRLHIMNDPTVVELHDPRHASCADLPHFESYSVILRADADARSSGRFTQPRMVTDPTAKTALTIAEGGDMCCPCGGAPPEP